MDYLTNNSVKYWDLMQENEFPRTGKGECWELNSNGHFEDYFYNENNVRVKRENGCETFDPVWKLKNDSTIIIYGHDNHIVKVTKDTLIIIDPNHAKMIFVAAQ